MDAQWPQFCKQQRKIRKSEGINPSSDIVYMQDIKFFIQHDRLFNESDSVAAYRFHVDPSGAVDVHVTSMEGARYALATLSQLINQPGIVKLPLEVHDWPSRPWRGMLLDVARHYLPIRALERMLNTMQALKMNVLHLHLTDSQVIKGFVIIFSYTVHLQLFISILYSLFLFCSRTRNHTICLNLQLLAHLAPIKYIHCSS
jgi:hypothetical protein